MDLESAINVYTKTMHKMNLCNTILANEIDCVTGPDSIDLFWKKHFDKLWNVYVNSDNL